MIDRLSRRHPRLVFHLVATQVETLHRELAERKLDFVIAQRFGPFSNGQYNFEHLYDDSHVVVAGGQNRWSRRRKIELVELVNEAWALPPPESTLGSIAVQAFKASGLNFPRTTVFTFPAEARISLLATGHFLTILPASLLRFSPKRSQLKVLPIDLPLARMPVGVFTLKNRSINPVASFVISRARDLVDSLGKRK